MSFDTNVHQKKNAKVRKTNDEQLFPKKNQHTRMIFFPKSTRQIKQETTAQKLMGLILASTTK
jgi:hypothetical protein